MKKKPVNPAASTMAGQELWTKLQKLGFSQMEFSRTIKVAPQTVRSWISDTYPVPTVVAMLINLMLKTKTAREELKG